MPRHPQRAAALELSAIDRLMAELADAPSRSAEEIATVPTQSANTEPASKPPDDSFRRAAQLLKSGAYDECVAILDEAIAANPDAARAYHLRGHAHMRLEQYELAVDDFTAVIERDHELAPV